MVAGRYGSMPGRHVRKSSVNGNSRFSFGAEPGVCRPPMEQSAGFMLPATRGPARQKKMLPLAQEGRRPQFRGLMSLTPLSADQMAAAQRWLAALDAGTRERGDAVFSAGNVLEVETDPRTSGLRAMVSGGSIYTTKLRFENRRWISVCSCPARSDCKHSVAVMLAAIAESKREEDALAVDDPRRDLVEQWQIWLSRNDKVAAAPSDERHELRVRLTREGAQLESRKEGSGEFKAVTQAMFLQFLTAANGGRAPIVPASLPVWQAFNTGYDAIPMRRYSEPDCARILNRLLRDPEAAPLVLGHDAKPLNWTGETLSWRVDVGEGARTDYSLALVRPDGSSPPPALVTIDGDPSLYLTAGSVFTGPPLGGLPLEDHAVVIPAEAMESAGGLALIERIRVEPPPRLAARVRTVRLRPVFQCTLEPATYGNGEHLCVEVYAESEAGAREEVYERDGWRSIRAASPRGSDVISRFDRAALVAVPDSLKSLRLTCWGSHRWHKPVGKPFPEQFSSWIAALPPEIAINLDTALASLREPGIAAKVRLEVEETGIDWFDVRIALDVSDTTLTKSELKALLDARGGFVRLGKKGWRRLSFQFSAEDEAQLADLGLSPGEFSGEPQRLHALQLAGKRGAKRLLDEEHARAIERRVEEIRTRVTPAVPASIRAELRPYQVEGFHFLAYLSANNFGGILADDMGLGKTLQTLAWLAWLREQPDCEKQPTLVVCPKSVVDNWRAEATRFAPDLRVRILPIGASDDNVEEARANGEIVVANYAQLRALEGPLGTAPWLAVILDEAQAIKNPESQTAKIAWKLKAAHRLALSGTPIENRLLDLWSILQFAMPGVLGTRAAFGKAFDQRGDPLARRRLSSRVRPFVIRRTKGEVAKDLPERIEEDLHCTLDGPQLTLYRAELKRARASLLQLTTQTQFDKARFNVLTSLLRLRQICCHPALVNSKATKTESAKLTALLDLVEPLIEEGHKVLVFSQFVEMLSLIRAELTERQLQHFILTGETENRGELVDKFQNAEGGAVFLISLRAGGFGLNLTAASYVVLFDPWWNPAVENQAIDRTHRIGQRNTVIAYRLLVKDTIEEKIRALQTQKRALAADILGEENFARTLSLDDFRFLLEE